MHKQLRSFIYIIVCLSGVMGSINAIAQTPYTYEFAGQRCYGGTRSDIITEMVPTADGGQVLVGQTTSKDGDVKSPANLFLPAWIVKTDATGAIEWQQFIGDANYGNDQATAIKPASDGGYWVCGRKSGPFSYFINRGWVAKLSAQGSILWFRRLEEEAKFSDLVETSDGGVVVVGIKGESARLDVGINKFSGTGELLWQKQYGGSKEDGAYSVALASDGKFVIAGFTKSNDGDVLGNHGGSDAWLLYVDTEGSLLAKTCLGGRGNDDARSVIITGSDQCVLVGNTNTANNGDVSGFHTNDYNYEDVWLVKSSFTGQIAWQRCLGSRGEEHGTFVSQTSNGGILIGAIERGEPNGDLSATKDQHTRGGYNAWLVQANASGEIQWQGIYGGTGDDTYFNFEWNRTTAYQTTDGYIVGMTTGSNNLDVWGNHGNEDGWVFRIKKVPVATNRALVSCYPLNGDANDQKSLNHGSVNLITPTTGRTGVASTAYSFTSSVNEGSILASARGLANNTYTWSAWVRVIPQYAGWYKILSIGGVIREQSIEVYSTGYWRFISYTQNGQRQTAEGAVANSVNRWVFVTAVRREGEIALYIDGRLVARTPTNGLPAGYGNDPLMRIGGQVAWVSSDNFATVFNGAIDEVKIYRGPMSAVEVQQAYTDQACAEPWRQNQLLISPSSTTVCEGASFPAYYTADLATGDNTLVIAQLSDALGAFTQPVVVGTGTGSPLSLRLPTGLATNGQYRLRLITEGAAGVVSDTMNITPRQPATATLTGSTTALAGQEVSLNIRLSGSGPWSYTLSNNATGSTSTAIETVRVLADTTTDYSISNLHNTCGVGNTSGIASVTVTGAPLIRIVPTAVEVCGGTPVQIPFVSNIDNPSNVFTLQASYYRDIQFTDPVNMATSSGSLFSLNAPQYLVGGEYPIRIVSSNPKNVSSETITMTLHQRPSITLVAQGSTTLTSGQPASLAAYFSGAPPYSFTLNTGQSFVAAGSPFFFTVPLTETTSVQAIQLKNTRCTGHVHEAIRFTVIQSPRPNLRLSMGADKRVVKRNEPITVTLRLTNEGQSWGQPIRVVNHLPAGLSFVSGTSPFLSIQNQQVLLSLPAMSEQESVLVTYQVAPTKAGRYVSAAYVATSGEVGNGYENGESDEAQIDFRTTESGQDTFYSPNPDQSLLPVVQSNQPTPDSQKADLSVRLVAGKRAVRVGETFSVSLVVANAGGMTSENIQFQVLLPAGLHFNGSNNVGGSLSGIAAQGTHTLEVQLQATKAGSWPILAEITAASVPDPDSDPNNGTDNGEDDMSRISIRVE